MYKCIVVEICPSQSIHVYLFASACRCARHAFPDVTCCWTVRACRFMFVFLCVSLCVCVCVCGWVDGWVAASALLN